jgi:hypothetical protein
VLLLLDNDEAGALIIIAAALDRNVVVATGRALLASLDPNGITKPTIIEAFILYFFFMID